MSMERDVALTAFDQAHREFALALAETPVDALRYRPTGEDYALGGLAIHVAHVLEKYARVLEEIRRAEFGPVTEPPEAVTNETDAALIRDGSAGDERVAVLERVQHAHAVVAGAVRALPADTFHRTAPVTYSGADQPFATSPADVLSWVNDHYREHTQQIADLRSTWVAAQTR
jgi:DinB superfamily